MMRDYPLVFKVNHFADMRYEPIVDKFQTDVITTTVFNTICCQLQDDNREDVLAVVKFLERTGERIGIFHKRFCRSADFKSTVG